MSLFYKLQKAVSSAIDSFNTPESHHKGDDFEKFAKSLFSISDYNLIAQTNGYNQNKDGFAADTMNPDFKYSTKDKSVTFFVECKFRASVYDDKISLCKDARQLERYRKVSQQYPVFILLGLGRSPSNPEYVCLVPLDKVKYPAVTESFLEPFLLDTQKYPTIKPALLKKYLSK